LGKGDRLDSADVAANNIGDVLMALNKDELAVRRAFKAAGFGLLKPHEEIKSFQRWLMAGRRPVEGSRAVRVRGLRLFCYQQTRPLTGEERGRMQTEFDVASNVIQLAIPKTSALTAGNRR
jgi:hypothetical protein